jgi:hypothetical protein
MYKAYLEVNLILVLLKEEGSTKGKTKRKIGCKECKENM